MSNEFNKCPNGHYYQGKTCPYCKPKAGSPTSGPTEVFGIGGGQDSAETIPMSDVGSGGSNNTTVVNDGSTVVVNGVGSRPSSRTVFDEEETVFSSPGNAGAVHGGYRETRKLVGWLVSYTLDALGVDFKLYEGRNIIGRDAECNISVNDNMVSGKHAVILFRAGKYSISDSQSSHGTFVNDNDIELEPCYLQDGDLIRMGRTVFKFRTSF